MTVTTEPTSEVHRHALVRRTSGRPAAHRNNSACATRSATVSRDASRARIDEMLSRSGIVTLTDDDLAWLRPGDRPADAIRWLMSQGPAILILTHGDAAATGYIRGGSVRVRGAAGIDPAAWVDAFAAGLLQALTARDLGTDRSPRSVGLDDLHGILHDANMRAAQSITPAGEQ